MKQSFEIWMMVVVAGMTALTGIGCRRDPVERGLGALAGGNPALAESLLAGAADSDPDNPTLHANLALARMKLGQVDAALSGFRRAADLSPDDPRPLEFMAAMAAGESRWRMSQELLYEAARRDSRSPRILTALAIAEGRTSGPQTAAARLAQVLAIAPNYSPAIFNLAILQMESLNQPEEAARLLERYISLSSDAEHLDMARAALRTLRATSATPAPGAFPQAAKSSRPTPRNVRSAVGFYNQGVRHHAAGELDLALENYTRAIQADPAMANAHYNLGLVHNARKKPDEARLAFQQALDIQPALADARYMLACILRDQGQSRAAIDQLETLVARNPDHAQAQHALGLLYKDNPATLSLARRAFEKYLQLAPGGPHAEAARNWLRYHN